MLYSSNYFILIICETFLLNPLFFLFNFIILVYLKHTLEWSSRMIGTAKIFLGLPFNHFDLILFRTIDIFFFYWILLHLSRIIGWLQTPIINTPERAHVFPRLSSLFCWSDLTFIPVLWKYLRHKICSSVAPTVSFSTLSSLRAFPDLRYGWSTRIHLIT